MKEIKSPKNIQPIEIQPELNNKYKRTYRSTSKIKNVNNNVL